MKSGIEAVVRSFAAAALRHAAPSALALFSLVAPPASASIEAVKLSSQDEIPVSRWIMEQSLKPQAKGAAALLARIKKAQYDGDFAGCSKLAASARGAAGAIRSWLSVNELECGSKQVLIPASAAQLDKALQQADKHPEWLVSGGASSVLVQKLIAARLALLEFDLKKNLVRAWISVDRLQALSSRMNSAQRARLYRLAGEAAFLQQKPEGARDLLQRSLKEEDSEDTRSRLASIESALRGKKESPKATPAQANGQLEASADEQKLIDRMASALKTGDLVPAVDDGVKLLRDFPGGSRAKWAADRLIEAYWSVAEKGDAKYAVIKEEVLRKLENVDGDRLYDWSRNMYNRGQYEDAYRLARKSIERLEGSPRSTKAIEIAADSASALERYDLARDYYQMLVRSHSGTDSAREALFRLGLIEFRQGKYSEAVGQLERLLVLPDIDDFELSGHYWLWRSLQKLKLERAQEQADWILTKYPFSYYALRVKAESQGNVLEWTAESKAPIETKIWLTARDRQTWERVLLLLKSGWYEEAQTELKELPPAIRPEDKALRARLWASAFGYATAIRMVNEAWDENPALRRQPFLAVAFPKEFTRLIETQAEVRNLDRYLVMSLIKQESSYNPLAVSGSAAFGLMQVIAPTAREMAQELNMKGFEVPDTLFKPASNVQIGTQYLAKMLRRYNGHVPAALAAYNAGPGRFDRWVRGRPSLKSLTASKTSSPENELWFDELPWSETSFYIKAILRNMLLYSLLDKGRVQVVDPVWESTSVLKTAEKIQ